MKRFKKILKILIPLLMGFISTGNIFAQVYGWSALGNGVDGSVYAITTFNNRIVVGGSFTHAGGVAVNNIAQWDGSSWSPLGNGLDNTVYSLCPNGTSLYAGGSFLHSGTSSLNHISRWDGSTWNQVGLTGNGTNDDVMAMIIYNGNLVVGGNFFTAGGQNMSHIAKWTNFSQWQPLGSSSSNGLNGNVNALTLYNGDLIVGGSFTSTNQALLSVNHIALWDEANWYNLGTGLNNNVNALAVWNNNLYVGGNFSTAGGVYSPYLAYWSGTVWQALTNQPPDDVVNALAPVNGQLVAGGSFKNIGYPSQYGSRIARWNGTSWSRMVTGMNNSVNTFFVKDSSLYAGGNFSTAGGDYISHISMWNSLQTVSVSGLIRYADSLTIVKHGEVFAIRLDVATRELIKVDSTKIDSITGLYSLTHVPTGDSLYIIIFPNDVLADNFVPTYHPSAIDWLSAVKIFPVGNLTNVNVNVIRVIPNPEPYFVTGYNISGHVYLNYTPPMTPLPGYPFSSGAIVYAKQGNTYRGFGISDINEQYVIPNMTPGTYDLFANRIGYNSGNRTITLGNINYDTANFWLDTAGPIGVRRIGTTVPEEFTLNQNYPNPFNPVTIISYQLPVTNFVKLEVYDILGRRIATLVNEKQVAGNYEVRWDANNISTGVYFYRLQSGSFSETKKMALIK